MSRVCTCNDSWPASSIDNRWLRAASFWPSAFQRASRSYSASVVTHLTHGFNGGESFSASTTHLGRGAWRCSIATARDSPCAWPCRRRTGRPCLSEIRGETSTSHRCLRGETSISHSCLRGETSISHRCLRGETSISHRCVCGVASLYC